MKHYLAYDIKGIQQFIFSVPKLKYVVGASLLIAEFDDWASGWHDEVIFTGGGRGIFHSKDEGKIDTIKSALVKKAQEYGLDLRLGTADSFSDAVHCADDLYTFVPNSLDGEPDAISGMLPTTDENRSHPILEKRCEIADTWKQESLDNRIFNEIWNDLPEEIKVRNRRNVKFLSNVDSAEEEGKLGSNALGNRNRWAIVCLDGNDMGSQFRAFEKKYEGDSDEKKTDWYKEMSKQLDCCTKKAFYAALVQILNSWFDWLKKSENKKKYDEIFRKNLLVLPFRPLILGGDDVTAIVHSSYALDFAKILIEKFNDLSKQHKELWVGTNGELTISAGIAYTNISLPLHTSIPYAESLLGSAKGNFRKEKKDGEATPAAIDWEHITESMLDTPAARRNRDLVFYDEDINTKITLTERPYNIEQLQKVLDLKAKLQNKPFSLLAECQTILTLPWAKRVQRLAAIKKHQPQLFNMLKEKNFDEKDEQDENKDLIWTEKTIDKPNEKYPHIKIKRSTKFLDAVSLLEEDHRLTQTTTKNN
ncbi:MAG: hypothetical protein LBE12_19705 [Planctomycetaceae bacterium]|jgi:hypothetical protein|nr:hypothetical protein [Planctomycetaceae bacterium]